MAINPMLVLRSLQFQPNRLSMKYIFLIFAIILVNKTKCHVTERVKTTEVASASRVGERLSGKPEATKSGKYENSVYLEDVVYALKNQNWTEEEMPCLNQTLVLLRSLQNFTLWAVWQWDSVPSEPQGLLFGSRYQLGNFDECLDTPWAATHPELKTQYCLSEIVLERTDQAVRRKVREPVDPYQSALDFMQYHAPHTRPFNELTWGVCVPAVCAQRSVERLMSVLLLRSHLGTAGMRPSITIAEPCQRADRPVRFDGLFYAFVVVMTSLFAIALICTCLNCKKKSDPDSIITGIIQCFCVKTNTKDLLHMKKEGIEVLYGIRFLTICFIAMDHQIGIFTGGPMSNGIHADQAAMSIFGLFVLHDDLFVDTFFLLSGFLTATTIKRFRRMPNPLLFVIKRYVRLVVAFAVVVFFICAVYPYTGSGPLWNRAITGETDPCRKNWWFSLLMLNNYVDSENICIIISWYIPCDFHFFVITVLVYWVYRRNLPVGVLCAGVLGVASIVVPGVINYVNNLPAVQLFTYDFVKDPRGSEQFHLMYIKSHTRYAAYVVGFFSGYIFASYAATGNIDRISRKWSILGALVGLTIMTTVMFGGASYLWREYSTLEGALYAALNRPVWACGVAMLVLCCSLGHVPLIKPFLSWYGWVPLSRLSYGLYLTHSLVISRAVLVSRSGQHGDYMQLLTSSAGVIVMGCVAALIIWLVAEAPANNLLVLLLKNVFGKKAALKDVVDIGPSTSKDTLESGTSGYLKDNMPGTVQYASKI